MGRSQRRPKPQNSKKILDSLEKNGIAYIPVIGDNEVQAGCEKEFQDVFRPHFKILSGTLDNWRKAPSPADGRYLLNFSFDYKDNVDSNYAGHLHLNWYAPVWSRLFVPLYHVRVTDETWSELQWPENDEPGLTVRWVHVDNDGRKISYHQNIENISKAP
jgi:hypothetical protein